MTISDISVSTMVPSEGIKNAFKSDDRHRLIAEAAYHLAEHRGFTAGRELDDWILAERGVNLACGLVEPRPRWDMG